MHENSLRNRRRKKKILAWLFFAGLFFVIFAGAAWLAHAKFLRVSAINISGEETISSSSVLAVVEQQLAGNYLYVFPRDNIFLYPKSTIAAALLDNIQTIKTADVHAENFQTISVTVVERTPVALWCGETVASSSSCSFVDVDGVIYAKAADYSGDAYKKYYGPVRSLTSNGIASLAGFNSLSALVDAIAKKVPNDSIQSIFVDEHKDARLSFASGFVLLFPAIGSGGDIVERLNLALATEPFASHKLSDFEYLDLRFGDKLYYKLK